MSAQEETKTAVVEGMSIEEIVVHLSSLAMAFKHYPYAAAMKIQSEKITRLCLLSGQTTDVVTKELSAFQGTIDDLERFYAMHGRWPSEIGQSP